MNSYKIVDADAHMCEPPNLWTERLDKQFSDRAPRVIKNLNGKPGEFFVIDEHNNMRVAGVFAAGKTFDEKYMETGFADALPGGWDPAERLKDMELDGVERAVLYTTFGFGLFRIEDPAFQQACFRAYNDWLAEFVSYAPERFAGLALVSLYDPEAGARELERSRKLGLKGALIWAAPPDDRPYHLPLYDRLWSVAQDLEMPLSLHLGTARRDTLAETDRAVLYTRAVARTLDVQNTILTIIFGGVLERFPRLKLVSAENDIGWVPFLMERADKYYRRWKQGYKIELSLKPSEYFGRQIYATFIDDREGLKTYHHFAQGVDNFMWSTDYPHQAATWPHSQEVLERDFVALPESDRRKIVRENTIKLYGFPTQ
jgi:predicted TIM-barrel fold metal-dependent hydrolase